MNTNKVNTDAPEHIFFQQILSQRWEWMLSLDTTIRLGYTKAEFLSNFIFEWMEKWVSYIEAQRDQVERYSTEYAVWMEKRGFTFKEYLSLFSARIAADAHDWYPIFEVLMIDQEEHRKALTQGFDPTEKDYLLLLSQLNNCPPTHFFNREFPAEIPLNELAKHAYVVGNTGSGKSELMKSLFYHLQKQTYTTGNKASLILMEPHGELAQDMRDFYLNKEQRHRLIYIDPFYEEGFTPVLNPFDIPNEERQNEPLIDLYSQNIAKAFSELIEGSSLSPQMEAVLIPCIATLLRKEGSSLAELQRFMNDEENDDLIKLGLQSPNPIHKNLFKSAFRKGSGYQTTKQSIYTKLLKLLGTTTFFEFTCGRSTLDLAKATDEGKIILFNLSQGKIGEDSSQAIGRLLIAMIKNVALRREYQAKNERIPTFVFIDECQNYLSPSIEKILTEARKYKVFLLMANQNLAQIEDSRLKDAIFSNTKVKIAGSNSPKTLKVMAQEMQTSLDILQDMRKYHFCAKVDDSPAFVFRSPSFLATNEAKFSLSHADQMGLKQYLLDQGYYRTKVLLKKEDATTEAANSSETPTNSQEQPPLPKYSLRKKTTNGEGNDPNPAPKYSFRKSKN
ncbi:type IV secretory system conjugative DNA transfer family protein [Microscilla marina]|uniref:TraD/TraG TraM recognition site domain-containing protein n=1 Tax=Microscilla marina ATCC 23134 TaxID=313606 RepID=A1ZK01_MICM2|nr:DUF87 domain-containing protein [Microscilla marina]EAY29454.1 conserved hypothetical protein [Microscilla marina ATCC 23134]